MSGQQKERVGFAASTHALDKLPPHQCGANNQKNFSSNSSGCQSYDALLSEVRFNPADKWHRGGVVDEVGKNRLWSALPADWRSLSSPLNSCLTRLQEKTQDYLENSTLKRSVSDKPARVEKIGGRDIKFPALPAAEFSGLSSNVAKVHGVASSPLSPPLFPSLPPTVGVQFYSNDVRLVRAEAPARGGGPRKKCTEITKATIKNAKFVVANSEPELHSLIACTYPATFPADGRIVKAHHKALLSRIRRKFGGFSYFTAFEYQRRGAPHFHIAISFDLSKMGQVEILQRRNFGRRFPIFKTVRAVQDWLFEAWLDIISAPAEVSYKKEVLYWAGLPASDIQNMRSAYYDYNSAVAWEIMRDDEGARHYMVKELSGLKTYQKLVPDGYLSPGRHFLYSKDMRPDLPIVEFQIGDTEIREILEAMSWRWLPVNGRPLNKTIWNIAGSFVIELLERGYLPLVGSSGSPPDDDLIGFGYNPAPPRPPGLQRLRRFDDLRMVEFMAGSDLYSEATVKAWFNYALSVADHWPAKRRSIQRKKDIEFIFSHCPD